MEIVKSTNDIFAKQFYRDYRIPRKGKKEAILRLEFPVKKHDLEQIRNWLKILKKSIND